MKAKDNILKVFILVLAFAPRTFAAVYYVDANNPNPLPPYTDWSSAATVLQDAVDAASPGDEIVVTNGVYATGGKAVYAATTNRVTVSRPLLVRSVNGPEVTVIEGQQAPEPPAWFGAVRGVYLTNGAVLSGFTLTNGATVALVPEGSGGGAWCESTNAVLTNCILIGNSAFGYGGGAYHGTLNNCTIKNNSAGYEGGGTYSGTLNDCTLTGNRAVLGGGGGAYQGTLNNCTLVGNSASQGGGAFGSTLNTCTLMGNSASNATYNAYGGGACMSALNNCTLTSNKASSQGGGAYSSALSNCLLRANVASGMGGGAYYGTLNNCALTGNAAGESGGAGAATLNNCLLTGNAATSDGGGAEGCTLNNCTVTGNSAQRLGGGLIGNYANNCIIYYNTAGVSAPNWLNCTFTNCATPTPAGGSGNITNAPLFIDRLNGNFRLQTNSPCVNAGLNDLVPCTTDLDGRPRMVDGTVDMGAYEFQGPGFSLFIPWLAQCGLPSDGSADYADPDHDGVNNWQEWVCGTDPTNAASALRLLSLLPTGNNVTVSWESVTGVSYSLERSTTPSSPPVFATLATNLVGQAGTTTFTDTNAPAPFMLYRVSVKMP